jgi:acyl-CoA reductase-like NAD-dependent aldehyde dehydrogenase
MHAEPTAQATPFRRPAAPHLQAIVSYDPATGQRLGEVQETGPAQLQAALAAAQEAQKLWAQQPVQERARRLRRVKDLLIDQVDELSALISKESGKPRTEALANELFPTAYLIDYFCQHGPRMLADAPINIRLWRLLGRRSVLQRQPRGVVAVISPWNFPFSIAAGEIVMALLCGNAVLFKPARATCLTGEALCRLFAAAELPAGLLQTVQGSGAALTALPVNFIAFTGSVHSGQQVLQAAAANLTPCMLELGGKDPMIVCHDANLEVAAATAVWGAFVNCGQACASIERVYVDARVAAAFTDKVVEKTLQLRQGHGLNADVDIGPLCTQKQFDAVVAQVQRAVADGATVRCGGRVNAALQPGLFYEPTVLTDVQQHWDCMQEETFGPTLPILSFTDEAQAVAFANDSKYALTASVWSRDRRRATALAQHLVAGTVCINEAAYTHGLAETPWGGPKHTGMGRTHGKQGLLEFTEMRHLHTNTLSGIKNPWLFPYSEAGYQLFKSATLLFRSGLGAKLRGLRGSLSGAWGILKSRC